MKDELSVKIMIKTYRAKTYIYLIDDSNEDEKSNSLKV